MLRLIEAVPALDKWTAADAINLSKLSAAAVVHGEAVAACVRDADKPVESKQREPSSAVPTTADTTSTQLVRDSTLADLVRRRDGCRMDLAESLTKFLDCLEKEKTAIERWLADAEAILSNPSADAKVRRGCVRLVTLRRTRT